MWKVGWVVIAVAGCNQWTHRDTVLELSVATVTVADWAQTRGITKVCQEENPVIGDCGQRVPVALFFPVAILAHAAVAAALPPRARVVWQGLVLGAETNQVWRNQSDGFGLDGSPPKLPPGTTYLPH